MDPCDQNETRISTPGGWFKTTHWSAVVHAGRDGSPQSSAALAQLCQAYWPPLYSFVRRSGHGPEDAKDLTQEFFARLLEKQWLAQADPGRGKFRSFLLAAMKNFLANERRRGQTAKRGGGNPVVSLDDTAEAIYDVEIASNLTPEKLYERRWALSLFDRALARLREDYQTSGKLAVYDALKEFLSVDTRDGDYAPAAKILGSTPGAVSVAVHRLRQRYRDLVREEIALTVENPEEVEAEMRSLLAALS
jgi:RNA polymerase sigma-70 factor (ECF subfamily)